jgi:hypothetical protein
MPLKALAAGAVGAESRFSFPPSPFPLLFFPFSASFFFKGAKGGRKEEEGEENCWGEVWKGREGGKENGRLDEIQKNKRGEGGT